MFSTLGVFRTIGGYHDAFVDILSTVEDVQYCGGYHDKCGDILSTVWCSVLWGMFSTMRENCLLFEYPINNKKRSHTQLDSRKQVIAFQDRVMTINIKEAQHPLK